MSPLVAHDLPHVELLATAAVSGFADIPADQGWSAVALDPENLPVLDGRAITATVAGVGRILVIARRGLAGAIEADLPSVGFVGVLSDCARTTLTVLGLIDGPAAIGHVEETDGAIGLAMISPHELVAVAIADGDAPRATIVIGRDGTAGTSRGSEPASTPVQAHDFAPLGAAGSFAPGGAGSFAADAVDPGPRSVGILADVQMGVTVELGRTRMSVREILALTLGSVIQLDRPAGAPVDLFVNGTLIARGEVVVIDEEFGIRVSEVIGYPPGNTPR